MSFFPRKLFISRSICQLSFGLFATQCCCTLLLFYSGDITRLVFYKKLPQAFNWNFSLALKILFKQNILMLHLLNTKRFFSYYECLTEYLFLLFQLRESNSTQVVLRNLDFKMSGNFSCEVTTDGQPVSTGFASAAMLVIRKYTSN